MCVYREAMRELRFRIVNVFTAFADRFSGNPLCVFEDGGGLDDQTMQRLARQLNLSETTFIVPAASPESTAGVRIFTPTFEMPFAGHPTLGTAHVVRALRSAEARVVLDMKAGLVEVSAEGDRWTLRTAHPPRTRDAAPADAIAAMLGLAPAALAGAPLWVDTGAEQLIIPLATEDAVRRARPTAELLSRYGFSESRGASMAYVWTRTSADEVLARFFFVVDGGVVEDPATGSAAANLGGFLLARAEALPVELRIRQGEAVARPSLLRLRVDEQKRVFVGGDVVEVARGAFSL
jgi:PhzF family phenazine biosynthesis protein